MRRKRKQLGVEHEIASDDRSPLLVSVVESHARSLPQSAEPRLPFCLYNCAAAHGMARGASTLDEKTRALFEKV